MRPYCTYYRPQQSCVGYVFTSMCLSTGGVPGSRGGLHPEGGLLPRGVPSPGGWMFPAGWSLVWGVCSGGGGVGIPACTADGMHTTWMHSCSINLQDNFTSRQRSCGKVNFQSCLFVIHSIERGGEVLSYIGLQPQFWALNMFKPVKLGILCTWIPRYVKTLPSWTSMCSDPQTCSNLFNLDLTVQGLPRIKLGTPCVVTLRKDMFKTCCKVIHLCIQPI